MVHTRSDKRKRLKQIQQVIEDQQPIKKSKLISRIEYDWGHSKRTATEYIETLKDIDKIKEDDGELCKKNEGEKNE